MENIAVAVSQLKNGNRIGEDVHSQILGRVLIPKGKIVSTREIEILKAFMIKSVQVENLETKPKSSEGIKQVQKSVEMNKPISIFNSEYEKMFVLLKKTFNSAGSGIDIPILTIRERLQGLIDNIKEYHPLTFQPPKGRVDDSGYHNSIMVSLTSYKLALWQGLPNKDLIPIAMGGLFHDIGNVKVDPSVLSKPSKLTLEELKEVKKHTIFGYNLLKNIAGINEGVKLAALQHHEKEDGSGYPLGVKGDKIHIYAKVVSIADIFHAMTSKRYYKEAISPYLVLEQILNESFGKLDPALVQTYVSKITDFHSGTTVKLSNGSIGEIVFTDRSNPTRPLINVNGKMVNLVIDRSLFIQNVII